MVSLSDSSFIAPQGYGTALYSSQGALNIGIPLVRDKATEKPVSRFRTTQTSSPHDCVIIGGFNLQTLISIIRNTQSTEYDKDRVYALVNRNAEAILKSDVPQAAFQVMYGLFRYGSAEKALAVASSLRFDNKLVKDLIVSNLLYNGQFRTATDLAELIDSPLDSTFLNYVLKQFRNNASKNTIRQGLEKLRNDFLDFEVQTFLASSTTPIDTLSACISLKEIKPGARSIIAALHCRYEDREFLFLRPDTYHLKAREELFDYLNAMKLTGKLEILGTLVLSFQKPDMLLNVKVIGGDLQVEHRDLSRVKHLLEPFFPNTIIRDATHADFHSQN